MRLKFLNPMSSFSRTIPFQPQFQKKEFLIRKGKFDFGNDKVHFGKG